MIKIAKAIGANSDLVTAQAFVYNQKLDPQDESEAFLLSLIFASGEDIFTKVRQLSPQIEDKFFISNATAISQRFDDCLALIKEQLNEGIEDLQLLLAFWHQDLQIQIGRAHV